MHSFRLFRLFDFHHRWTLVLTLQNGRVFLKCQIPHCKKVHQNRLKVARGDGVTPFAYIPDNSPPIRKWSNWSCIRKNNSSTTTPSRRRSAMLGTTGKAQSLQHPHRKSDRTKNNPPTRIDVLIAGKARQVVRTAHLLSTPRGTRQLLRSALPVGPCSHPGSRQLTPLSSLLEEEASALHPPYGNLIHLLSRY